MKPDPYGPNTPAVRRFLQRLAARSAADCATAARAYLGLQGSASFRAADRALGEAIEKSERTDARDAVVGPIVQLVSGHAEKLASDVDAAAVTTDDIAEAALAAALAIMVGDVIPADAFEVLYRPFAGIIPIEEIEKGRDT
jgi:hypothetical protein